MKKGTKEILGLILGLFAIIIVGQLSLYFGFTGGSHSVARSFKARIQLDGFYAYARTDPFKTELENESQIDNAKFVSITKLDPTVYKRNDKGEVLDPWGLPYVISRDNGQISITSPGLDQYNKLSEFQKWWSNE